MIATGAKYSALSCRRQQDNMAANQDDLRSCLSSLTGILARQVAQLLHDALCRR